MVCACESALCVLVPCRLEYTYLVIRECLWLPSMMTRWSQCQMAGACDKQACVAKWKGNRDICVVPLGRGSAGKLQAPQAQLMHAMSSCMRKGIQPVAHVHKYLYADPGAQVAELQTLRDFARGQGKRDGVTAMLCGAHGGLKCAARYSEEMKARVMTPATRSMHGHATGFGRGQQSRNVRGRLGRRRRRGFAPRHHDGGSGHSNEKGHLDRGGYGTGHRGCRGHNRA